MADESTEDKAQVHWYLEEELRREMKAEAYDHCEAQGKAFAECCRPRTVTILTHCMGYFSDLKACIKEYCTDEELEKRKKQWVEDTRDKVLAEELLYPEDRRPNRQPPQQ